MQIFSSSTQMQQLIIIPRVYTNKPRTTGEGYKGIASQPDPEKAPNMVEGQLYTTFKTAPTEEEREKARQEYLDKCGMHENFRW